MAWRWTLHIACLTNMENWWGSIFRMQDTNLEDPLRLVPITGTGLPVDPQKRSRRWLPAEYGSFRYAHAFREKVKGSLLPNVLTFSTLVEHCHRFICRSCLHLEEICFMVATSWAWCCNRKIVQDHNSFCVKKLHVRQPLAGTSRYTHCHCSVGLYMSLHTTMSMETHCSIVDIVDWKHIDQGNDSIVAECGVDDI